MTDGVLVAGAGPTGLMTAYELVRRGVPVRLIDAADGPATTSRAAAIHARTIEVLDQVGLYEAFEARAVSGRGIAFYADGAELASMDATFTTQATRFDQVWFLDQVITEELLREALAAHGVSVEWGARLIELAENPEAVTVRLRHADGTLEEGQVAWLVGADGGHSVVRDQLGVRLTGESSETWLIADAELDFAEPLEHDRIRWIRADGKTVMIFPLVGDRRWRLLDTVDVAYDGDLGAVAERFAGKLSRGLGREVTVATPSWVSVFTIQQRAVPVMQSRAGVGRPSRCFLVGDAAHVHSPASGQGLNTGLQDAVNLAWKLAAATRGELSVERAAALLDSYSAERVPVGQALLSTTQMATALVNLRNSTVDQHLPAVFATLRALPPLFHAVNQGFLGGMSGLAIAYPTSPLTVHDGDTTRTGPRPGQRLAQVRRADARDPSWQPVLAALREPGWTLLVAMTETAAGSLDVWRSKAWPTPAVHPVDGLAAEQLGLRCAQPAAETTGWLLVRPDGHVAARGRGSAELDRALARIAR
ncbi:FAD-dependent oxidoreductase [Herbidospora daliensis]|uniref:FAD-dependent oxidoreductase n=1 Tax=Herbidospora daliensis TaxID=295585 RepID=UPI000785AF5C|nr:FAD-dependent oxidoreductase [Herbidospora daliensis]